MEPDKSKPFYKDYKFYLESLTLIVLSITLYYLIQYTYHTKGILDETQTSNQISQKVSQISQQPFLDLWAEYENPFIFENKGAGPALNIFLLHGNEAGDLFISPEDDVLSALAVNKTAKIRKENLEKIKKNEIVSTIPALTDLADHLSKKDSNWICLVYEDIFKNSFATVINGSGNEYNKVVEFIQINDPN